MGTLGRPQGYRIGLGSRRARAALARGIIHTVLLAGALFLMIPLVWMFSTSLKDLGSVFEIPPQWIPDPVHWENYLEIFRAVPFGRYIRNTSIITALSVMGKVLSCSLVAFAFARLRWRGRDALFLLMLSTLMLPHQVTLIPQFMLFRRLDWVDTYLPMIVPEWLGGPFLTFLLRQYYMTIPLELDEAARIDGASIFDVYRRITLPLSRPALIAVAIFTFEASWNEFLRPLIYLHDRGLYTIALGLRTFQDQYVASWHLMMGASLITMLPVLFLFFAAQKYFMQGVVFTGVKG